MVYSTFKDYLSKPKSLAFERMEEIHDLILRDISGDPDAEERYPGGMVHARESRKGRTRFRPDRLPQLRDRKIQHACPVSEDAGKRRCMERYAGL